MANRGDLLLIVGLVLSGFALLFLVIGFSTPHWLELDTNYITHSGFEKLGLWEACFRNFAHYKDYNNKQFNGCWWIFSEEYRPIWSYINPSWFLGIQIMMTLTLMMEIMTVLIAILVLIKCCPGKHSVIGLFILGGTAILSGILTAISVIIFGAKSATDNNWIETPEKNIVSWSFGCVVFSGFLILFAGVSIIVGALHAKLVYDYDRRPARYAPARHESRH